MAITTTGSGACPKHDYIEIGSFTETRSGGPTRASRDTRDAAGQAQAKPLIRAALD